MRPDIKTHLKTDAQIQAMRQAGLLTWQAHQVAAERVRPGVTTAEIDAAVESFLVAHDAIPLFKGVPGPPPFPAATCISINEQVVHGIPGPRPLRPGDVVSIDIGVKLNGWCGDAAVTYALEPVHPTARKLLDVTEGALALAIRLMGQKPYWSEVAREIERYVKQAGFSLAEGLVEHSIGREMWEGLQVPNGSSRAFEQQEDFPLEPGLVLAVEPMVNVGTGRVRLLRDHWTIITADGAPSAHFEHTVALTAQGPQRLTAGPDGAAWASESLLAGSGRSPETG